MIVIISEKLETITLKLSKEFTNKLPSLGECNLDSDHQEKLAILFEEGPYHPCTWASILCAEDGKEYRGDGKHSAGIFSSGRLPCNGKRAMVIRAKCDTLEEVGLFYNQFNQPETSRDATEINQSVATYLPKISGFSKQFINRCVRGIVKARGSAAKSLSRLQMAGFVKTYQPFVIFCYQINYPSDVKVCNAKHLHKVPVVAAMFIGYEEDVVLATEFWQLVRDGSNPNLGHPDRALYRFLLEVKKTEKGDESTLERCLKGWENYKALKRGEWNENRSGPKPNARGRRRKPDDDTQDWSARLSA